MAKKYKICYNHEMRRVLSTIGTGVLIVLALALYREWVIRNRPPTFLPLGFFEQATQIVTAEEAAQNPASWEDHVGSVVMDTSSFDSFARDSEADERKTDILVVGATLGGVSAALSAASEGANVVLATGDDWEQDILVQATMYAAEEIPTGPPSSSIEQDMRAWRDLLRNSRSGVIAPRALADRVIERVKNTENIAVIPNVAIVGIGKDSRGRVDRALLRTAGGNEATSVRFSYIIDGTDDGAVLALAGVPTATSWDDADAGVPDWPAALAQGYSMSGWTVAGIGRRLDGAHAHIGIVDRGYHGQFVAPAAADDCWLRDETRSKTPFIARQPLLRSVSIDCAATMRVESSFEDTAEIFFINHGNEQLSATVTIGSGTALHIQKNNLLQEPIVFIGAFPISPRGPLTVDISSMLPGDRLEGLIVRKTNANAGSIMLIPQGKASMTFTVQAWKNGSYDLYATMDPQHEHAVRLDGIPLALEQVGPFTYAASGVHLSAGTHTINALSDGGIRQMAIIPVKPHRETVPLTPLKDRVNAPSWVLTPNQGGVYALTAEPRSCEDACRFTLVESGSTTPLLSGVFDAGAEVFSTSIPIGIARLQEGTSYILRSSDAFDAAKPPTLALLEKSADIYAIASGEATIRPPVAGGIYDMWVRGLRSSQVSLTVGKRTRMIERVNEWRYAGTEQLASNGATVSGKGTLEIMAIPNVQLDAYAIPLYPGGNGSRSTDIPPGNYSVKSFGPQNPITIGARHDDGSTEALSFRNDGDSYTAETLYAKEDYPVTFSLTEPWPQRIVLFEDLGAHSIPITMSGGALHTLLLNSANTPKSAVNISSSASGTLLFDPYPQGIGPVTIGMMETGDQNTHIRHIVNGAYLLLHLGRTHFTETIMRNCGERTDPICDVRRFTRAPDILGTPDGITPTPYYPDARRLEGLDTLTSSGAFAIELECDQCDVECIDGSALDGGCIAKSAATIPPGAIVSFPGVSRSISIVSPEEETRRTLKVAFSSLRKNRFLRSAPTYLEKSPPPRDVSLTLGMFFSPEMPNVLAANAAVSSTHAASRALRSQYAHMAIGSAIGHAAAFALVHEHADLDFIEESYGAIGRLQRHLAEKGITVMPLSEPDDDPLLVRALQQRILDGKTGLTPVWTGERLTFAPTPISNDDVLLLSMMAFGGKDVRILRDVLLMLPGAPTDTEPTDLLRFGIETGIITVKMLQLSMNEIMHFPLDEALLLKAAYIFHLEQ